MQRISDIERHATNIRDRETCNEYQRSDPPRGPTKRRSRSLTPPPPQVARLCLIAAREDAWLCEPAGPPREPAQGATALPTEPLAGLPADAGLRMPGGMADCGDAEEGARCAPPPPPFLY